MMGKTWWEQALFWGLWFIVMSLVMGWVSRQRFRSRTMDESKILVHPTSTLIIGLASSLFFFALTYFSSKAIKNPQDVQQWMPPVLFTGFALLGAVMIVDYFRALHVLTAEGIRYRGLLTREGFIPWCNLRRVSFSPGMKWFRLESHTGDIARISVMVIGLPEFARLVLAKAPPEAIDPDCAAVLATTASGNPPSVWQ